MMKFSFAPYTVPPDTYRWKHADGTLIESSDRKAWFEKIKRHHEDNGYPLPENWKELAEDQLCKMLPPGWCLHEDGRIEYATVSTRMEIGDFWRGVESLRAVVADPDPFVTQGVADARAKICASCPANQNIPGCNACMKASNFILDIKGKNETEADPMLRVCSVCKCPNQGQVWIKARLLQKTVLPEHMASYDLLGHCWKAKTIRAQDDTAGLPSTEAVA